MSLEVSARPVSQVLQDIDSAQTECMKSQQQSFDPVVESEIEALGQVRAWVTAEWPLPLHLSEQIQIGAVAAKNIADWNPGLADLLMRVDYALRHGGEHVALPSEKIASFSGLAA